MPPGSTDLAQMLATLDAEARPEEYVYASLPLGHPALATAAATVVEAEGVTAVLPRRQADAEGIAYDFVAAWVSLTVHSSLEAVGLTAAFAAALGAAGISCNVLAGYHRDHLLVPVAERERTLKVLRGLAAESRANVDRLEDA